ncbi:hypothetical protein HYT51_01975 [Candidatus Woesearchaeota archaeon]|nr:hypothetical protein [Candidatus Woesearchaeota archaeon]
MPDLEILSEKPLSLEEMKKNIEEIKKRDKELNFRTKKTEEYLHVMTKTKCKKPEELKKELEALDILRLKPKHIAKLLDTLPQDLDSLRMIFSGETLALKQEDLPKIIELIKKHT